MFSFVLLDRPVAGPSSAVDVKAPVSLAFGGSSSGPGNSASPTHATGFGGGSAPAVAATAVTATPVPVPVPTNEFEEQCKRAADAIRASGALLFCAGAGLSAESGVPTSADINALAPYRAKGLEYPKLASPFWLDDDPDLFYGFWGSAFNDARDAKPHAGHAVVRKWRDKLFGHTTALAEGLRDAAYAAAAAAAAAAATSKTATLAAAAGGNRASKRASRGVTVMSNASEVWAKHQSAKFNGSPLGAPPSPANKAAAAGDSKQLAAPSTPSHGAASGAAAPPSPSNAGAGTASTGTAEPGADLHHSAHNTPLGAFFWFTTNVDAGWVRAGFSPREVFEAHGNVERWQCVKPVKCKAGAPQTIPSPDSFRFALNSADLTAPEKPGRADTPQESFALNRPMCKCGAPCRPWVFQSGSDWAGNSDRARHYRGWLEAVRNRCEVDPAFRVVIVEVGAGTRVATTRVESHDVLASLPAGRCLLVRINPDTESTSVATTVKPAWEPYVLRLKGTAVQALTTIDRFLPLP